MIIICVGNVGSGKTLTAVKDIMEGKRTTYSNITTNRISNNNLINSDMIIKKEVVAEKKKRDGTIEPVIKMRLNKEFWQGIPKPIDVVLDEAHTIINSRRSMSTVNIIVTDWLALIRRVLGSAGSNHGRLILITQLVDRIDIIARSMATQIRHHRCYYICKCDDCGYAWKEHSDMPEPAVICPKCTGQKFERYNHTILVHYFKSMRAYEYWEENGIDSYYKRQFIHNVSSFFKYYDTLSWDNLLSEAYL